MNSDPIDGVVYDTDDLLDVVVKILNDADAAVKGIVDHSPDAETLCAVVDEWAEIGEAYRSAIDLLARAERRARTVWQLSDVIRIARRAEGDVLAYRLHSERHGRVLISDMAPGGRGIH